MSKQYVRFVIHDANYQGILEGDHVTVLEGSIFGRYDLTGVSYSLAEVQLLPPCTPSKIICVGLNYRKHAEELALPIPAEPILFLKPPTTLLAPGAEIVYWPMVGRLDYEGELALVMGKTAHMITEADALQHVFGYTIANDITARDLQQKDGQWTRAKSFDTFLPLGPSIVTDIDVSDLSLKVLVNGTIRQDGRTSDLIFSIPYLISFISQVMTLYPGDVIITGTPSGIGPLQVGDMVEVSIEGLGSLRNKVTSPRT